jgi:glutamate-1-semialdehyde 2,1-aminomutase
MAIIEPGHPGGAYNNVTTMVIGIAVLEDVWTEEAATELFAMGAEWLQGELRRVSEEAGSILRVIRVGSLMTLHFSRREVRSVVDVQESSTDVRELFFFDMLEKGFFLAQPEMINLMTVTTKAELESFIVAVAELGEKEFVCAK